MTTIAAERLCTDLIWGRRIRLGFHAEPARLGAVSQRVVRSCCHRWRGRSDFELFPPLHRWRSVAASVQSVDGVTPYRLISAAVCGLDCAASAPVASLAAAIMLSSGCPVTVISEGTVGAPASGSVTGTLGISILAMYEDDTALAERLAETVIEVSGGAIEQRWEDPLPISISTISATRAQLGEPSLGCSRSEMELMQ
ncbi:hypothetical protein [Nocardia sp. NBC_00511]|uniref:hypothetical protein n=1 Tax=Nocardia sp. NBC_00511 TaxID=2903591 RepID=UPI0030E2569C